MPRKRPAKSKGTALFLMAEKRDNDSRDVYQQLEQKVRTV